jgi:hypothetical protein
LALMSAEPLPPPEHAVSPSARTPAAATVMVLVFFTLISRHAGRAVGVSADPSLDRLTVALRDRLR